MTSQETSWYKNLWLGITLRPFGNDLLTRGGSTYLGFMCVVMLIIALVEGLAWGHALSTSSWLFGVLIGVLIFVFMLALDVSLATQNLLQEEHAFKLDQPVDVQKPKLLSKEWVTQIVKGKFGLIVRLFIAGVSLWVTAGFVTEFIFKSEIEQKIASIQTEYIKIKKDEIQNNTEALLKKLDEQRVIKEAERTAEANKGGVGDRTKMLVADLEKIDKDIQSITDKKSIDLNAIDQAYENSKKSGSFEEMITAGVQIAADSPTARGQIIDELKNGKNNQAFWRTEIAVRVIMFILAFGLVLFKLGQKRELALYYSSRLQEKWSQYQLGIFDQYLAEEKRYSILKNAHSQLPEEFEQIMIAYAMNQPRLMQELEEKKQRERDEAIKAKTEKDRQIEIEHAEKDRIRLREHTMLIQSEKEQDHQEEIKRDEQERIRLREKLTLITQEEKKDQKTLAEEVYWTNLAKTKALDDTAQKSFNYRLDHLKCGMSDLQDMEVSYLQRHRNDLERLKNQEDELLKKFIKLQKDYRTQEEQIEKRRISIEEQEAELEKLKLLLEQAKLSEDSHQEHVVKQVIFFGDAIRKKQDYIRGKKYRLREFENNQQFFKENCDQVHCDLEALRTQRRDVLAPYEKIVQERSRLEQECAKLASDRALSPHPYQPFNDLELPFLVEKLNTQSDFVATAASNEQFFLSYHPELSAEHESNSV